MAKTNWKEVIWGGLVFALLVGLTLYGITSRPIVDYNLKCSDKLYVTSNVMSENIKINFRNRGLIDANVLVVIDSINASIEPVSKSPTNSVSNNSISLHYGLSRSDSYSEEQIKVTNTNASSFTLSLRMEKVFDWSISGIFSKMFGELKGYYPTLCIYNKTNSNNIGEYERTS